MNLNLLNDNEVAQLRDLITVSDNIVIISHQSADGDAVGSSLGWRGFLMDEGKKANVILPDLYPDFLKWLPDSEKIIRYDKHEDVASDLIAKADLIFCLDFNVPSRIGNEMAQKLSESKARKVLIDHHIGPNVQADLVVSYPLLSSTSEMVFRIIEQLGGFERMNNKTAQCIYCGMMTDTGGFTFNSTTPEIFHIISLLLSKKIDKDKIYRNVYNTFSENRLRLLGYVMYQKLNVLTPLRASYYTLSRDDLHRFRFVKGDAEGLVNMPLQIKGMRLSISLREDTEKPNLVWVSLRSVDDFPCNEMAGRFFNGGGHKNASGGRLFCSLKEAEQITRDAIKAYASML